MVRFDRFTAIAFSAATLFGVAACSDSTGAGTGTVRSGPPAATAPPRDSPPIGVTFATNR